MSCKKSQLMPFLLSLGVVVAALSPIANPIAVAADDSDVKSLLKQIGVDRGICVVLGEDSGELAVALAKSSGLTVYVQSSQDDDVRATRKLVDAAGLLGTRVYVDKGRWSRVHLGNNLADAVIVRGSAAAAQGVSKQEVMRVLQPRGKAITGEKVEVKPVPKGTGEWTHPYHGADNNPQSEDLLARAPYLTQFLTTPWYGPMPGVTTSAGGRIFKAFGHLAFKKREWPMLGKLVALNGYNGTKLWERKLTPGFMIHRSTIVATEDTLYLADNTSCKLIDAATGKIRDEIVVPKDLADGSVWKWMTIQVGVLYALVGEDEKLHVVHRGTRTQTGWPWTTVRSTYGEQQTTWGFGRTMFAMNPKTKKILWTRQEDEKIDSRGVCMASGRIFLYSHKKFVAAVDAKNGETLWKTEDPALLKAIGEHDRAQTARLGYATSAFAKCNDKAVFYAGPQRKKLVAVSVQDGRMLWNYDDGNVQLVLRSDGLYAMGRMTNSKKFDFLTGEVLADLKCFRGNCTRATGTVDSIFARGYRHSGTLRFDVAYGKPRRLASMRPACQDGVVVANGLLYWGPWMCDCNHSLVGVISLGGAGDFDFSQQASNEQRLESLGEDVKDVVGLKITDADWPTYRKNNSRFATSPVSVPKQVKLAWQHGAKSDIEPTAPVAAGGLIFVAGSDGIVRAIDAESGKSRWTAYTGGAVQYPPTVADSRVFVGSGDGWIYAFEAVSGRRLWRFRAAPTERKIPVYGRLLSSWPVASGVMVQDGVAYAAAGIASHDGTHVYALDAATGKLKWQNNTSGNLIGEDEVVGVSVQGHMLFHDGKVHMAGGNVVSPAIYDSESGECLNKLEHSKLKTLDEHWKMQRASRGSELFVIEGKVAVAGRMLYSPRELGPPSRYNAKYLLQASSGEVIIQGTDKLMVRVDPKAGPNGKPKVVWKSTQFARTSGVVLTKNAVVVVGQELVEGSDGKLKPVLAALNPENGQLLWSIPLPERATKWGIAIDRDGRVVVTLIDGRVLAFAG